MSKNQPHIHIVDDSKEDILLFQHILEEHYEISFSVSGKECLETLNTMIPDIILLDVYMEELDGYEVCERIREQENTKNIYIIFTTAATSREEKLRGYAVGGDDYITKPIDSDVLTAKLFAFQKQKKWTTNKVSEALEAAYDAMYDSNDLAVIINFLHNSFSCYDFKSLANEFFFAVRAYKIEAYLQIFTDGDIFDFQSEDFSITKKQDIISNNRHKGKIIVQNDHILINYNNISVILTNFPDTNTLRYQKIFDKTLMLIEGLQQRSSALMSKFILEKANLSLKDKTQQLEAQKIAAEHLLYELEKQKKNLEVKTDESLKAKQEAEEATRSKSTFLSNMSHEIRTPMNAIIGFTDLAIACNNLNTGKNYLKKIQSSSKLLLGILNDILDVSKIESGMFGLETIVFNLFDILDDISDMFSHLASQKKIKIIIDWDKDTPNTLTGDPLRLRQILANLLNNAIKFTDNGNITLNITPKNKTDDDIELLFSISDSGIGMTQEEIARLFKPFSQSDESITRKYGGTGLGLNICKHLVNLMDGDIWIESTPQQGSTFYFTIKCQYKNIINPAKLPEHLTDIIIITIEDNPVNQSIITAQLKDIGANPKYAVTDENALDIFREHHEEIDLIITDWDMPNINGIDLSKQIMDISDKPVIIITSYDNNDIRRDSKSIGIHSLISKPITQASLIEAISNALSPSDDNKKIPDIDNDANNNIPNIHVLLVEDNKLNQELAMELLQSRGFDVDIAGNGQIALEMLKKNQYHLILMDIQMPVLDGIETTKIIRSNPLYKSLPIIATTADAQTETQEKCISVGFSDYITKPICVRNLFKLLYKWFPEDKRVHNFITPERSNHIELNYTTTLPICVQAGIDRLDGDINLYNKMIFSFYKRYNNIISKINEDFDNNNTDNILHTLHALKGLSGTIEAKQLHTLTEQLETAIKHNNDCDILKYYTLFKEQINLVFKQIIERRKEFPEKTINKINNVNISLKELNHLLENLEIQINKRNFNALEYFNKIINSVSQIENLNTQKNLETCLINFNFTMAKKNFNSFKQCIISSHTRSIQ